MNPNLALSTRRHFLRGVGITLSLPWLESLGGILHAADVEKEPRRLLLVCLPLGIFRDALIPKQTGIGYEATEYPPRSRTSATSSPSSPASNIRASVVVMPRSLASLPASLLPSATAVRSTSMSPPHSASTRASTRSRSAPGPMTSVGPTAAAWCQPRKTSLMPSRNFSPRKARPTKPKSCAKIGRGKSILDFVLDEASDLRPRLSKRDQDKLEEYFESVRATEKRLVKSEEWMHTPKPQVGVKAPAPFAQDEIITNMRNVCDLTYLAFKTDSTRVITFGYFRQDTVAVPGVKVGYHNLSHHGQDEGNIAQLKRVERAFFDELKTLLTNLKNAKEGNSNLLARTTIVITSNLGSGSSHSNKDLPVLLAGGRFQHGQHLALAPGAVPLSNLYLSVLHQLGMDDKSFGASTGTLKGLELA